MPTYVIVIFLLFFAVLAFGWFYLQRAKARDVVTTDPASSSTVTPAASAEAGPDTTSSPVDPAP